MVEPAEKILNDVFGYAEFRGSQSDIVRHVIGGGDALVLMPTGGGKSLCYQIPALARPGLGIVVSPLIALMQDQVDGLRQLGIRAASLNSTLSRIESRDIEQSMVAGQLDLLYVAPERLLTDSFLHLLHRCNLALFAIDEAHCVSQWGHDFRPEYRQLAVLGNQFPGIPRVALTATADGPTRRDIAAQLKLRQGRIFVASFDRPNIQYRVAAKENARAQLLRFLKQEHAGESGIVYCLSRNKVEETASWLRSEDLAALPYHAGIEPARRAAHQRRFLADPGTIIVATIAFGMGIDKPDVRFVAHLDLPKSLEAYYQETGRAGRDGLAADAWMVYGMQDIAKLRHMITTSNASDAQRRVEHHKLQALVGYCETTECRRKVLLGYFDEVATGPCGNCDTCLMPVETFDGTEVVQKLLSCVYRTGQIFGAGYVIDVLRGSESERIRRFRHDRLTTYGIGKDISRRDWQSVIRQVLAIGLLEVDMDGHGGLKLGPDCRDVLRGERTIQLRRDLTERKSARSTKSRRALVFDHPADEALFESLRAHRLALAKQQSVPPYIIFHDSVLAEMAIRRPKSLADLATIPGVGTVKLERYGTTFLSEIFAAD